MRKGQRGVSLMGLIMGVVIFIVIALFAMKLVPSFLEYRSAKAAVEAIARQAQSPTEVRRLWEGRAAVDDITTIQATDLQVSKEGNQMVIGFAYRKEVPLFGNVGLYIDYAATSKGGQ
jgi:hypothetical protein